MRLLLLWLGCSAPDPCDAMCAEAEVLYGACLEGWGATWTDAGYADGADFHDACETWAWEMRLIEAEVKQRGWTDEVCEARAAQYASGECADFTETDWAQTPSED